VDWGLAKAIGRGQQTEVQEAQLERTADPVLSPMDLKRSRHGA
jgi:hypothetical protein